MGSHTQAKPRTRATTFGALTMAQTTHMQHLDPKIQALCKASLGAREHSYSPYSKFKVGASLQCPDGSQVSGCNVENASYGLTICAERTAVVKAVSMGLTEFQSVAISADLETEFNPDMTIYLVRLDGMVQV